MDFTTIFSMLLGFALIILGITGSGELLSFWDWSSVQITIFGTLAAAMMSYPFAQFRNAIKAFGIAFKKHEQHLSKEIDTIISIANVARRDGLLALEGQIDKLDDPFMKKGIMLIVDGSDPQIIREIMETELDFMVERHGQTQAVIEQMAAYSPAFGMLGTLIGLINMLLKMDDPSAIGPNMSVALVTTFYGVVMANLVYTPIARKLKSISTSEYLRKELLLEGLLSVQDGENPRIIKDKLEAFLARVELGAPTAAKPAARERTK